MLAGALEGAQSRTAACPRAKSVQVSRRRAPLLLLLRRAPPAAAAAAAATTTSTAAGDGAGGAADGAAGSDGADGAGEERKAAVLSALRSIIDPDLGDDIVSCGFVKDLAVDAAGGAVSFRLHLTTPACPVKDRFKADAESVVGALEWVQEVQVAMSAAPPKPLSPAMPPGLVNVSNILAVYSCKGGVGKSTVSVNLAYALAQMGARVGILDADIYGPSLPTMVSPEVTVLEMDAQTKRIKPNEYKGVKCVSFGYASQGAAAIMRGPMASGVVEQLLTTTDWGELDYLLIDMPPGTGDIQLTLCQGVPLTAAVVVTTPQKLAFVDVAKGVRMFARLRVPCAAVVENMAHFEVDGVKHFPFGKGSGERICQAYGVPNLIEVPIEPDLSAAGDCGEPAVVSAPASATARTFGELGAAVVKEVSKIRSGRTDILVGFCGTEDRLIAIDAPGMERRLLLRAVDVRRADRGAASVDEWTGERLTDPADVPEDIEPQEMAALGNYAVQILWPDGLNQVAPLDQLQDLPALTAEQGGAEFDMQRQWAQPPEIEVVDESEEVADPRMAMLDDGTEVQMPAL